MSKSERVTVESAHLAIETPESDSIMASISNLSKLLKKNQYSVFIQISHSDRSKLKCSLCHHVVNLRKDRVKLSMDEHLKSKKHTEALREDARNQQTIVKMFEAKDQTDQFNYSLVRAFVETGIPLFKLNHGSMRKFLESALKVKVFDRRHLTRKYLPIIFEESISEIRKIVSDNYVYFIIDESPDLKFRAVVNVLVGVLNGSYVKPMLLMVKLFDSSIDNRLIMQTLNDAANRLWPGGIKYEKVQLVISDAAAYMIKAFEGDQMYPNLIHVTCLAHAINRVCDAIHDNYALVDQLVSLVKRTLGYSKNRRRSFVQAVKSLPPKACATRWGTFLETAEFYYENIESVRSWIESQESNKADCLTKLKSLSKDPDLQLQLLSIRKCFFIKNCIIGIEQQGLNIDQQLEFVNQIKYNDWLPEFAKKKLESCLVKNTGFVKLMDKLQNGHDFEFKKRIEFAPLVSCDVERSFSTYKHILSDRRTNLSPKTIEMLNICMFNRETAAADVNLDEFE